MSQADNRSVPDLLKSLINEVTELFRSEARLVRSEMDDKFGQVQLAGGELVAGAVCLLVALFVLSQALVAALTKLLATIFEASAPAAESAAPGSGYAAWAAIIVGVFFAIVGIVLLQRGRANLKPSSLSPDRTINQVRKDGNLVKEKV